MKGTVKLYIGQREVKVLKSSVLIHDFDISFYLRPLWVKEQTASGLRSETLQDVCTQRRSPYIPLVRECVNCCSGALTDIDCVIKPSVAGVIDAVTNEQNKIAADLGRIARPAIAARSVDRIEYRRTGCTVVSIRNFTQSGDNRIGIIRPVLGNYCFCPESHDEGSVGALP
jgi:hypothetical protein